MTRSICRIAFVLVFVGALALGGIFAIEYHDYVMNAARRQQEKVIDQILSSIRTDRYTYDLVRKFTDPFDETELTKLMNNFRTDYNLTFRALVAGEYLKDSSVGPDSLVVCNLTVVNDAVDFVSKHRLLENGIDDPSGVASLPDLIKLMHYRNSLGYAQLENGTRVTRRALTDMLIKATMAWADDSRLVLPTIGDTVVNSDIAGIYPIVANAPYSQNVCCDPRYSFYPIDERGEGGVSNNGTSFGIWGESYSRYIKQGYSEQEATILANKDLLLISFEWVNTIEFVPTKAAADLSALSIGHLNATEYRPSYTPEERQYDLQQGDVFLVSQGSRVDQLPVQLRPFAYVERGLEHVYETRGVVDGLIYGVNYSTAFRNLREELVPDIRNVQLYVSGVQYIVGFFSDFSTVAADPECWATIEVDDSTKVSPDYWFHKYPDRSSSFEYFVDDGKLIAVGEPAVVPIYDYPFIDTKKTEELWRNSPQAYEYKVIGKCFLFLPHLVDEGNPWYKVFDNVQQ